MKYKSPDIRYKDSKGDLDLMVDVGNRKKNYFEITCLSTHEGFRRCLAKINAISWHGFYFKDNNEIKLPIIKFKTNREVKCFTRHTGIISIKEIFMFPICSYYIPKNISCDKFSYYSNQVKEDLLILNNNSAARVDIFVLPRHLNFSDYLNKFSHSFIEIISDITIYDKSINCAIYNLPIDNKDNMELKFFDVNNYCIVTRTLYTNKTREGNLIEHFSVLFHDPNNVIERIVNRRYFFPDTNKSVPEFKSMLDRYNSEKMNFQMPIK